MVLGRGHSFSTFMHLHRANSSKSYSLGFEEGLFERNLSGSLRRSASICSMPDMVWDTGTWSHYGRSSRHGSWENMEKTRHLANYWANTCVHKWGIAYISIRYPWNLSTRRYAIVIQSRHSQSSCVCVAALARARRHQWTGLVPSIACNHPQTLKHPSHRCLMHHWQTEDWPNTHCMKPPCFWYVHGTFTRKESRSHVLISEDVGWIEVVPCHIHRKATTNWRLMR